ncbi:RNA 2',3'-cyclic phosphodiesterase [Nitrosopumilus sp. K4]|nr:RNA 2',3'-cyclic phosphodiesterase [Nitrosopumilus sp. K4]QUC65744.1 RNA 2',3'-cyclic phosphodiesterase [Nitrosopumilus sp. K4]
MRTFVAVEISDKKVIDSISKFQSNIGINAKAVNLDNLHFTLQFLGEISDDKANEVKDALAKIEFSEFVVNFQGIGVFPKLKFPRVIWIGTDNEGGNKLVELAKKVENTLAPLGFTSDKPFRPHVTVFRIKNKIGDITREMKKFENAEFGSQKIINFKFKQSTLTPNGPLYSDLGEVKSKS